MLRPRNPKSSLLRLPVVTGLLLIGLPAAFADDGGEASDRTVMDRCNHLGRPADESKKQRCTLTPASDCAKVDEARQKSMQAQQNACALVQARKAAAEAALAACNAQRRAYNCQAEYARALQQASSEARREFEAARQFHREARAALKQHVQRQLDTVNELLAKNPNDPKALERKRRLEALLGKWKDDPSERIDTSDITGTEGGPEGQQLAETLDNQRETSGRNDGLGDQYGADSDVYRKNAEQNEQLVRNMDPPAPSPPGTSPGGTNPGGGTSPTGNGGGGNGGGGGEQQPQQQAQQQQPQQQPQQSGGGSGGGSPQGSDVTDPAQQRRAETLTPRSDDFYQDEEKKNAANPVALAGAQNGGVVDIDPAKRAAASQQQGGSLPGSAGPAGAGATKLDAATLGEGGLKNALQNQLYKNGQSATGASQPFAGGGASAEAQASAARSPASVIDSGYSVTLAGGSSGGGGGSRSSAATEEVLSPFAKPLGDPKVLLANSETDASVRQLVSTFTQEEQNEAATVEVDEDGIGSKNGPSLFARSHSALESKVRQGRLRGLAYR